MVDVDVSEGLARRHCQIEPDLRRGSLWALARILAFSAFSYGTKNSRSDEYQHVWDH